MLLSVRDKSLSGSTTRFSLDVCNYADDTTIYTCGPNVENVVAQLENDALVISEWFPNNRMKLNEDKCHLMILVERATKSPSK